MGQIFSNESSKSMRSCLLCALLVTLIISAIHASLLYRDASSFSLQISMSASVNGSAVLYVDTGVGYSELETARSSVKGDGQFHAYTFSLPVKTIYNLRFDPLATDGSVSINNIMVVDGFGRSLLPVNLGALKPAHQIRSFDLKDNILKIAIEDHANDPQINIALESPLIITSNIKAYIWQILFRLLGGFLVSFFLSSLLIWMLSGRGIQGSIHMELPGSEKPTVLMPRWFDGLLKSLCLLLIVLGCVLAVYRLSDTGLTWDECVDLNIVRDYVAHQSFLTNLSDPSQGRLSHLFAAIFIALAGASHLTLKLPFVIITWLGGVVLWAFLRKHTSSHVALAATAFYFCNPYVLAAGRTSATAGDALSCALTIAFVAVMHQWLCRLQMWPWGYLCALACGLATGAKWTNGLWIPAASALVLWHAFRAKRRPLGTVLAEVLAFQYVAVIAALLASPTLMLGLDFVRSAIQHSLSFDIPMLYFGEMRYGAPWFYVPAVLGSKLTFTLTAFFVWSLAVALFRRILRGASLVPGVTVSLIAVLPIVPLMFKVCQNAQYYVGLIGPMIVVCAAEFARILRSHRRWSVWMAWTIASGLLIYQAGLSIWLSPDFLQAGRQFGRHFQGQFHGPAALCCQGHVAAIRVLEELVAQYGNFPVYQVGPCHDVMQYDISLMGSQPTFRYEPYSAAPATTHYLLFSPTYDVDPSGIAQLEAAKQQKYSVTRGCERLRQHPSYYEIYLCKK